MAPPTPCLHTSFSCSYSLVTCEPYTISKGGPQQVTVTQRFPDRKKLWRVLPAASEPRFSQRKSLSCSGAGGAGVKQERCVIHSEPDEDRTAIRERRARSKPFHTGLDPGQGPG